MPFACGDDYDIVVIDISLEIQIILVIPYLHKSPAFFDPDELVNVGVHFQADIFPDIEAHQGKLQVLTCPQSKAEIRIFFGCLFDIDDKKGFGP